MVGRMKHATFRPLVENVVDALDGDKHVVFWVQKRVEVVPKQVPEVPNHIVRPEDAVNDGFGIA